MEPRQLAESLTEAAQRCGSYGFPVSARVLARLAQHAAASPAWWAAAQRGFGERLFGSSREPAMVLLAALHDAALASRDHPLARFFPTCGGADGPGLEEAVDAALAGAASSLWERLRLPLLRAQGAPWATQWLVAARRCFGSRKLPFDLVHVGLSVELSLVADLCFAAGGFDSELVRSRISVDRAPLDLWQPAARRWVAACFLPEQQDAAALAFRHVEQTLRRENQDKALVQRLTFDEDMAGPLIAKNVPDSSEGLLIYTDGAAWARPRPSLAKLEEGLLQVLEERGDRAVWADLERDPKGLKHALVVHRVINGQHTAVPARFYEVSSRAVAVSDLIA